MTGARQVGPTREVSARLVLQVGAPAEVILQLAVAGLAVAGLAATGLAGADGEDELTIRSMACSVPAAPPCRLPRLVMCSPSPPPAGPPSPVAPTQRVAAKPQEMLTRAATSSPGSGPPVTALTSVLISCIAPP